MNMPQYRDIRTQLPIYTADYAEKYPSLNFVLSQVTPIKPEG